MALHGFSWLLSSCRGHGRRRWITLRRCTVVTDHPDGMCEQALDRGLRPRLSIGTLQLSSRCSSIHFLPRRSFPVSDGPRLVRFGQAACPAQRLPMQSTPRKEN